MPEPEQNLDKEQPALTVPATQTERRVTMIAPIAWPLVALIMFVALYMPLKGVVGGIEAALRRADTLTLAGFAVKLAPGFVNETPPDVRGVLAKLTQAQISELLKFPERYCVAIHNSGFDPAAGLPKPVEELLQLGILAPAQRPTHGNPTGPLAGELALTPLGMQTREALGRLTRDLIFEVERVGREARG